MPKYEYDWGRLVYIKQCSCCKTEIVGTNNEDESVAIFQASFSPSRGSAEAADEMQSRCWVCNSAKRRSLGITLELLRDMHQNQEGCCAICQVLISLDRGASNPANVDHDSDTGQVRSLLCGNCNRGLGLFFHDTDLLRAAIEYLDHHKDNVDG